MSICIYRHKKLYVVMPRLNPNVKRNERNISFNFSRVANDICQVTISLPDVTLEHYEQSINVSIEAITLGNPVENEYRWDIPAVGNVTTDRIEKISNETNSQHLEPGNLANLLWSLHHKIPKLWDLIEKVCSRSVIELLMHDTEVDAESYDILQMYFDDNHQFIMNTLPIRPYEDALVAACHDQSESADEWHKLFEKA